MDAGLGPPRRSIRWRSSGSRRVALGLHGRLHREHRWTGFDHVANFQRARIAVVPSGKPAEFRLLWRGYSLISSVQPLLMPVGRVELEVGRVGHWIARLVVVLHDFAADHPAVAGAARIVEAAEEHGVAAQALGLVVLVEDQGRLGDAGNAAVVDHLQAPGTVLEVVRHEDQVSARTLVLRQAGDRIDGVVRAVADFVPVLAALAAVTANAARAPAGDDGAVSQRELGRFQRRRVARQRRQAGAAGRERKRRGGGAGPGCCRCPGS